VTYKNPKLSIHHLSVGSKPGTLGHTGQMQRVYPRHQKLRAVKRRNRKRSRSSRKPMHGLATSERMRHCSMGGSPFRSLKDLQIFGTAFARRKADGTIERVDPKDEVIQSPLRSLEKP
jgi:hypothetical protein